MSATPRQSIRPLSSTTQIIADADAAERRVLSRVRYRENRAVLHTAPAQMPRPLYFALIARYVGDPAGAPPRT